MSADTEQQSGIGVLAAAKPRKSGFAAFISSIFI
jgi:hypothetical protein